MALEKYDIDGNYALSLQGMRASAFRAAYLIVGREMAVTATENKPEWEERRVRWASIDSSRNTRFIGVEKDFVVTADMLCRFALIARSGDKAPLRRMPTDDFVEVRPLLKYPLLYSIEAEGLADEILQDLTVFARGDQASFDTELDLLLGRGTAEA